MFADRLRLLLATGLVLLSVVNPTANACYWDRDTLRMEREQFPSIHELIVGYFVRHSPAYYEWRVRQGEAISPSQRTPSDHDDLAVAYDKLGRHDEAISLMLRKIERFPRTDRYESEANLGTFLVHAGKLKGGLVHIKKAIAINPDAHFGREIYQQLLVEYLLEQMGEGEYQEHRFDSFARYVLFRRLGVDPNINNPGWGHDKKVTAEQIREELQRAAKGVAGMIRFGNHDSPILMDALGSLLAFAPYTDMPLYGELQQLAARAHLRAGQPEKAKAALHLQEGVDAYEIWKHLNNEVAAGRELNAKVAEAERRAIDNGTDPDILFVDDDGRLELSKQAPFTVATLPFEETKVAAARIARGTTDTNDSDTATTTRTVWRYSPPLWVQIGLGLLAVLVIIGVVFGIRRYRRRQEEYWSF